MQKNTALIAVAVSAAVCVLIIFITVLYFSLAKPIPPDIPDISSTESKAPNVSSPSYGSNPSKAGFDSANIGAKADEIFNTDYADFSVLVTTPETGTVFFSKNIGSKMVSASVIKLFIMLHAYSEIKAGQSDDAEYIESLIYPMITASDNDATNKLIDIYSFDKINATISQYGFTSTALNRKMLDADAQAAGIENYTSCDDCCSFLSRIYTGSLLGDEYDKKMLDILRHQQVSTKIRAKLPNVNIANKTGELSSVENDVGIVFASESGGKDFILCVLSNNVKQNSYAREAIAEYARYLYDISILH